MTTRTVLIFNRFERFWHWTQAAAILVLLYSGFGIHGLHTWGNFGDLVSLHVIAALYLMVLWLFAIFWHLTTGEWKSFQHDAGNPSSISSNYLYSLLLDVNNRLWIGTADGLDVLYLLSK